ncbi:PAS domain S-box-containing protein [Scopulibacillus darangshiensis]|uniref:HTH-type transcriptional regulatory protein TyrR n=1 Tax=Scopulibacillus darangshiensis TaxID=442528 RepID=A0A4R2NQU0_9BACL|nr:sigma 54-interacting transcriptional regulator [Scopulibacillus darangshiensis]TCP23748.1 PAS domain S-box-containing protein [Scopulibacillus darangshiensis]
MKTDQFQLDPKYFFQILNAIDDDIYISDKNGTTLWVNDSGQKNCGMSREELIGKKATELEQQGVFKPSAIKRALEAMKTITTVQKLPNGKKFMGTGHVILDYQEELKYVIAHRRDITNVVQNTSDLELKEIESLLQRYIQEIRKTNIRERLSNKDKHAFIGQSLAYVRLTELIEKIAGVDTTVLITGETGVGKNLAAEQIHNLSERCDNPLIHINCAAIPESLIESELFGYERGSFTGANSKGKAGLVKLAEHGTLFLDEISELPLHIQSKLLQLLQNKTYMPIGAAKTYEADVRIIAATNQNLEKLIKDGQFRADLFYRLNVLPVKMPPLRERKEDIFPLLYFYLKKFNVRHHKQRHFSSKVIKILQNYDWPGNIRELENLVEQLVVIAEQDDIFHSDLPEHFWEECDEKEDLLSIPSGDSLTVSLQNIEKKIIRKAYKKHKTIRKTANALGITHSLLMRRLKKYDIVQERD